MSRARTLRERGLFLVVVAFLAFMPPLLLTANQAALVFGLPVFLIYVFVAWAAVIAATGLISGRLSHRSGPGPNNGPQ